MQADPPPAIPLARAILLCRCPRCGGASLYRGLLTVRDRCPACDLDFSRGDTGDGGAFAGIMILSVLLVVLAFWVEFRFDPPLWVHIVLWPVLAIPLAVLILRPSKAALIALQYRFRAGEMGL